MSEVWLHIEVAGNRIYGLLRNGEWGGIIRFTAFTLLDENIGWKENEKE